MDRKLLEQQLQKVIWDYNIPIQDAVNVFEGRKSYYTLTREKLYSRLLMSTRWYDLIDIFGIAQVKEMLRDDVLKNIHIKDVRDNFVYARNMLHGI